MLEFFSSNWQTIVGVLIIIIGGLLIRLESIRKVIFLYDNKEYYIVPEPKRIVRADIWCKKHADRIGGIIKHKGNRIAVFREI